MWKQKTLTHSGLIVRLIIVAVQIHLALFLGSKGELFFYQGF